MYTGIVQTVAPIKSITRHDGYTTFFIELPERLMTDLQIGASVSVEGVCLSVTSIDGTTVTFDAMDATLERTNLGMLKTGDGLTSSARPSRRTKTAVTTSRDTSRQRPNSSRPRWKCPAPTFAFAFPKSGPSTCSSADTLP